MSSARSFMVPKWTETVADLRATEGVRVYRLCSRCGSEELVDLDKLIDTFGPLYSLWNRRAPCETSGCEGRTWYRAQPPNYFHRIMKDAAPEHVDRLHQRWKASLPPDVRDTLPVIPMLQATDMCIMVGCGRCELRAYLGATDIRAWGASISLLQLIERVACSHGCEVAADLVCRDAVPEKERPI